MLNDEADALQYLQYRLRISQKYLAPDVLVLIYTIVLNRNICDAACKDRLLNLYLRNVDARGRDVYIVDL